MDKFDPKLFRIMDANLNRAKEGLRVCEDICRFLHNRKTTTERYKDLRHRLTEVMSGLSMRDMIRARDSRGDVGGGFSALESHRRNAADIFYANSQRAKESIRVLEEFAKLKDQKAARQLKRLRYSVYTVEKEAADQF